MMQIDASQLDWMKIYRSLPARTPIEVLRRLLEELPHGFDSLTQLPQVTLHLRSGSVVGGRLLRGNAHPGRDETVLLIDDSCMELVYLSVSDVTCVRVQTSVATVGTLGSGALPKLGETAPSRLELKRQERALSEQLAAATGSALKLAIDWDSVPEATDANASIREVLTACGAAVQGSSADAMGRASWATLTSIVVRHEASARSNVTRDGKTLTLVLDLLETPAQPFSLRESFEAAL